MSDSAQVGDTGWHRTNNFCQQHDGLPLATKVVEWLESEALCLLENEDGAMIICHQDDVTRVEAELRQARAGAEVRKTFAQALLYAGEWAFDSVYDGEAQEPGHAYVTGCRETVAHLLACYLVQHGGYAEGFGTAEARDLIDWQQPLTKVEQWEELLESLEETEAEVFKSYRVTVIERRELSFDVEARNAEEAEKLAADMTSDRSVYDEMLDDEIKHVEEI